MSSLKKLAPPRGGKAKLDHVGLWKVADPPLELAMQLDHGACLTDINLLGPPSAAQVRAMIHTSMHISIFDMRALVRHGVACTY